MTELSSCDAKRDDYKESGREWGISLTRPQRSLCTPLDMRPTLLVSACQTVCMTAKRHRHHPCTFSSLDETQYGERYEQYRAFSRFDLGHNRFQMLHNEQLPLGSAFDGPHHLERYAAHLQHAPAWLEGVVWMSGRRWCEYERELQESICFSWPILASHCETGSLADSAHLETLLSKRGTR